MSALDATSEGATVRPVVRTLRRRVRVPLSALSFWVAIALPAVYLPLLAAGIDGQDGLLLFLGLLTLHVIALVGGRDHGGANAG